MAIIHNSLGVVPLPDSETFWCWRWESRTRFQNQSNTWVPYSAQQCASITEDYVEGRGSSAFKIQGQRFVVNFKEMTQKNEEYPDRIRDVRRVFDPSVVYGMVGSSNQSGSHWTLSRQSHHYKHLVRRFDATKGWPDRGVTNNGLEVESVECRLSLHLLTRFWDKYKALTEAGTVDFKIAFHGTTDQNTQKLAAMNFDPARISSHTKNFGWFGKGFYLSERSFTALGYNSGSYLLACIVMTQRIFTCPPPDNIFNEYHGRPCKQGYDAHYSPTKKELVIFDMDQILPCFLLKLNMDRKRPLEQSSTNDYFGNEIPEMFLHVTNGSDIDRFRH